jgi:LMBR1 domain-containing protein 1
MAAMWDAFFWLIPIWVFVFIPFSTFYYEADDGMLMAGTAYAPNAIKKSRFGQALCYQMFVFIFVGIFFAVTYVVLSDTSIPVTEIRGGKISQAINDGIGVYTIDRRTNSTGSVLPFEKSLLTDMGGADIRYLGLSTRSEQEITLQVSISTFYAGLMAWIGWFLFAVFGGIGLAALPLDLILAYVKRPKHMNAEEFAEAQMSLRERVNELVDIGELIKIEREEKAQAGIVSTGFGAFSFDADKRKAARDERQAVLGFKQAVFLLEKDVEDFQAVSANYDSYNPLIPYISFFLGCCASIISLFWFIHIIVYVYPDPPLAPFLNNYFDWFDKWFPLFGVLSVALFTVYLLFCAVKGCFKFGIRFLVFHVHPMKPSKTYMSSFMFNIGLVLLCALPVVQFCQDAFADYAANAEIRQIFGVQIQYLQFFTFFWTKNIFVYIFMAFTVMTIIYLSCRPTDTAANGQALRDRLKSRVA